ncbi:MAG: hypothetical protein N4R38_03250 [Lactobacillus crispatus]|nr:hypothetical protein [Lactobacillus crispatus]
MNIKEIERDILDNADQNLNSNTGLNLANKLIDKWGGLAFDTTNKLQKQGYLKNCDFFMGGDFSLGFLTKDGKKYLNELNGNLDNFSTANVNNFYGSINNFQQGNHNAITNQKLNFDYDKFNKILAALLSQKRDYLKETEDVEFYNLLDEVQKLSYSKAEPNKIKKLWHKMVNILASEPVTNTVEIIKAIMDILN